MLASLVATDRVPPYPSAGALYPGHPFLIEPGPDPECADLSYVDGASASVHRVADVATVGLREAVFEPWAWPVGCLLVLAVDFRRIRTVYGDRGLRFGLMEVGAMGERWRQAAERSGLGTCPVGGFHDTAMTDLVGLDPEFFGVALLIATGHPARK